MAVDADRDASRLLLFVHHGAELYGSDRVLEVLIRKIDRDHFYPVLVLGDDGVLAERLRSIGVEVHVAPVGRVGRLSLSVGAGAAFPWHVVRSARALSAVLNGRRPDLVISNTLAVWGGAAWAKLHRVPHIWHVHELVEHPKYVSQGLPRAVARLSTAAVCPSTAIRSWLVEAAPALAGRVAVVHNGLRRPAPRDEGAVSLRAELGVGRDEVLVAMVGRINRWKGQGLLVEAAGHIGPTPSVFYALAGDAPQGQEHFEVQLRERIDSSRHRESFHLLGFREDVWPLWDACDIAVVPSIEPEPFGLVAVEAMLAGKPVVAADHGGLREIVRDGETGLRFTPGDPVALGDAIHRLVRDPMLRKRFGERGLQVAEEEFSEEALISGCQAAWQRAIASGRRRGER